MAKPTGALLSFGASGTIGKTAVFASWRGRQYVRKWVVPANPRTSSQTQTRSVFQFLVQTWKQAPVQMQEGWTLKAKGQAVTDRNLYIGINIPLLRTASNTTSIDLLSDAKGGLSPDTLTLTPGAGTITADLAAPPLPDGWSIDMAIVAALQVSDPHDTTYPRIIAGTDDTTPYSVTLTGLDAVLYVVNAQFRFIKPDGTLAYGPALADFATPS